MKELLIDPARKADVARIREAAREMRVEYKRHAKEPQWDLVRKLIANPLQELRSEVNEELMRLASERNALVPIDRDPVPSQYQKYNWTAITRTSDAGIRSNAFLRTIGSFVEPLFFG